MILEQDELLETLPSDEARCGRLSLLLPPDKALSMGTGTGTKGDAIFLSCALLPRHHKVLQTTDLALRSSSHVLDDD